MDNGSGCIKFSGQLKLVSEDGSKRHTFTVGDIYSVRTKGGRRMEIMIEAIILPKRPKLPPMLLLRLMAPATIRVGAALEKYEEICTPEEREQAKNIGLTSETFGRMPVPCMWLAEQDYVLLTKGDPHAHPGDVILDGGDSEYPYDDNMEYPEEDE